MLIFISIRSWVGFRVPRKICFRIRVRSYSILIRIRDSPYLFPYLSYPYSFPYPAKKFENEYDMSIIRPYPLRFHP